MSGLLNALDGFDDRYNVVRICTGNDTQLVRSTPALLNRMTRIFEFYYPTEEHYDAKFQFLIQKCKVPAPDPKLYRQFLDKVTAIPRLTLRPYTKYVIRHILNSSFSGNSDYMEAMLENIEQLEGIEI